MVSPPFSKPLVEKILRRLDIGSSIAEEDQLLGSARVETSVFTDLLNDKVDLIPGTKGSGKSALYRILVEFLPGLLLSARKVVVAHGVEAHGDIVFHAFRKEFDTLSEDAFIDFWCIYLVSLAHEHFLRGPRYSSHLTECSNEIDRFRQACQAAQIPEIQAKKSLGDVLANHVFVAEIDSQRDEAARIDWRRTEDPNLPHRRATLPASVQERLLFLMHELGLKYGAIDLVRTPDNDYVFLEINPNGQWLWLEDRLGLRISDAIIEWLVGDSGAV